MGDIMKLQTITDIYWKWKDLSDFDIIYWKDFKNKPYGYTAFQDLIVGEYEYKESLVKLMISSVVNSPKLYISRWIYNIDIPDIIDKGNSTYITNDEWQYIKFNVKFYYIPDVVGQVIGGNNIQARVIINEDSDYKITTEGFYYKIVDNNGSILKNQKIHWQAIGGTLNGKNTRN